MVEGATLGWGSRSRSQNHVSEDLAGDGAPVAVPWSQSQRPPRWGRGPSDPEHRAAAPAQPVRQRPRVQPPSGDSSEPNSSAGAFEEWDFWYCLLSSCHQAKLRHAGLCFCCYSSLGRHHSTKQQTLWVALEAPQPLLSLQGLMAGLEPPRGQWVSELLSAALHNAI